jgi:GntR family transcriptional regulator
MPGSRDDSAVDLGSRSKREQIAGGDLAPGDRLPSEESLRQEHGLSRNTVRRAILTLRNEGLLVVDPPRTTRVRERPTLDVVHLSAGTITARMPSPAQHPASPAHRRHDPAGAQQ